MKGPPLSKYPKFDPKDPKSLGVGVDIDLGPVRIKGTASRDDIHDPCGITHDWRTVEQDKSMDSSTEEFKNCMEKRNKMYAKTDSMKLFLEGLKQFRWRMVQVFIPLFWNKNKQDKE